MIIKWLKVPMAKKNNKNAFRVWYLYVGRALSTVREIMTRARRTARCSQPITTTRRFFWFIADRVRETQCRRRDLRAVDRAPDPEEPVAGGEVVSRPICRRRHKSSGDRADPWVSCYTGAHRDCRSSAGTAAAVALYRCAAGAPRHARSTVVTNHVSLIILDPERSERRTTTTTTFDFFRFHSANLCLGL